MEILATMTGAEYSAVRLQLQIEGLWNRPVRVRESNERAREILRALRG